MFTTPRLLPVHLAVLLGALCVVLAGCGSSTKPAAPSPARQRAVLADRLHMQLPSDLQVAGRGEIAPSPDGS
jgi:predicted component of type VI protein secretion system